MTLPTWYVAGTAFVFGAAIASFLCVVAERVPRNESINGRSHCICGRQLKGRENIPVLGWLLARGRAKCCGQVIPVGYLLAEISGGTAAAAGVLTLGGVGAALAGCAAALLTGVVVIRRRS